MPQRWKVTCSYDGTDFSGWQSQPDGNAVQDHLERRLAEVFKEPVKITGSGRTDAGVHARGQVFHFDWDWKADASALKRAIQSRLSPSIRIERVVKASKVFHARFSAVGKCYRYRLYMGVAPPHLTRFVHSRKRNALDKERMQQAARCFLGWHDFEAFAANRGKPYDDTMRYLQECEISFHSSICTVSVEGNGFLYRMVRSIVGAMLDVADQKMQIDDLKRLLEGHRRSHEVVTAPAQGLTLEKVYYVNRHYPPKTSSSEKSP